MGDQQAFREKTIEDIAGLKGEILTLKAMLNGQGKDVKNIKTTLGKMWDALNWCNSKVNWFLGGIAGVTAVVGIILGIAGLLS